MASCFFLIRSSVDRDKITKTVTFSTLGDFGFSMSPRDVYYRFYKISPVYQKCSQIQIQEICDNLLVQLYFNISQVHTRYQDGFKVGK